MRLAATQPPDEIGVHVAEEQLAAIRPVAQAGDVVEHPLDFSAGEVGVNHQAGLFANPRLPALCLEIVTDTGGAAVLPDDGVHHRAACLALPDDSSLALVGNADGGDIFSL